MKQTIFLFFLLQLASACQPLATDGKKWRLVYETNRDGSAKSGSKKELLSAIRNGAPVRVGWYSEDQRISAEGVEHFLDATFLTIANGEEVFAQIEPFIGQRPDLTSDTLSMTLVPSRSYWILSTNGTISSVGVDFQKDTANARYPRPFPFVTGWYVED